MIYIKVLFCLKLQIQSKQHTSYFYINGNRLMPCNVLLVLIFIPIAHIYFPNNTPLMDIVVIEANIIINNLIMKILVKWFSLILLISIICASIINV